MEEDLISKQINEDLKNVLQDKPEYEQNLMQEKKNVEKLSHIENNHQLLDLNDEEEPDEAQQEDNQAAMLNKEIEKEFFEESPTEPENTPTPPLPNLMMEERKSKQESLDPFIQHSKINKEVNQTIEQTPFPAKKQKEKAPKKLSKSIQTLQNNKYVKIIFSHFCKENYISSIKSTLFQDKQKSMEVMPLNKWMVFCKEFDIFSKLCALKIQQRKKGSEETQTINMENSRMKEQLKVKQMKEVQRILGQIFKKSTENHTKMEFHHFLTAIKSLREEFKTDNEETKQQSDLEFAKMYLYCQSEVQCMQKLSNLKFTFGIPQIDYSKMTLTPSQREKSKSKFNTIDTKQNYNEAEMTRKKTKGTLTSESKTMILNPIIKEAKDAMTAADNRTLVSTHRKPGSKIKLGLDQPKGWRKKKQEKGSEVSELLTYLDSTKDEILQSYFKGEKMLSAVQKTK